MSEMTASANTEAEGAAGGTGTGSSAEAGMSGPAEASDQAADDNSMPGGEAGAESGDFGSEPSADPGLEAGESGPPEEGGEDSPGAAGDNGAPTAEAGDSGEVDEGTAEQSAMDDAPAAEAAEVAPATNDVGPDAEGGPQAERGTETDAPGDVDQGTLETAESKPETGVDGQGEIEAAEAGESETPETTDASNVSDSPEAPAKAVPEPEGPAEQANGLAEATEPDPAKTADPIETAEPTDEPAAEPEEQKPEQELPPAEESELEHADGAEPPQPEPVDAAAEPGEAGLPEETALADDEGRSGTRPDVPSKYPGEYVSGKFEPPAVDKPHCSPESWAGDINKGYPAPGRNNNCGECARAVQSTWEGEPAAAAERLRPEPVDRMSDWAGTNPTPASMADVQTRLNELGPGSSAIVGCGWESGGGHWFNAVNDGGTIKAIDGQSGLVGQWPPSTAGVGFDPTDMNSSDAIYFTPEGKVVMNK